MKSIVMAGLESSGKSAIFRGLTKQRIGDESNFRGSTVLCRSCRMEDCGCDLVDTPGIRLESDSETTRLALKQIGQADVLLMVARGTHVDSEFSKLMRGISSEASSKKSVLVLTFKDKADVSLARVAQDYQRQLGIPVVALNARQMSRESRTELMEAIQGAKVFDSEKAKQLSVDSKESVTPKTIFEYTVLGKFFALTGLVCLYALPVMAAYKLAEFFQPIVDTGVIEPLKQSLAHLPAFFQTVLIGGYGVLTLGWYSFLWAFPVVLFISASTALASETGISDRITAALDPWLRRIGLSGRDLTPVLTGFGCNVVAVFQSRSCSACTRKSCVSMISFASACSYQIGASLSVFGASGHTSYFLPYIGLLFLIGAIHTRIWNGGVSRESISTLNERSFLQAPSWGAAAFQIRSAISQFLLQAMPIFILICLVAGALDYFGVMQAIIGWLAPVVALFSLPETVTPALVFSFFRKDGLLVLNQGEGALLQTLSGAQIFISVYLASTLTACLVTLWTIRKEMGWRTAGELFVKQLGTAIFSALLLSFVLRFLN